MGGFVLRGEGVGRSRRPEFPSAGLDPPPSLFPHDLFPTGRPCRVDILAGFKTCAIKQPVNQRAWKRGSANCSDLLHVNYAPVDELTPAILCLDHQVERHCRHVFRLPVTWGIHFLADEQSLEIEVFIEDSFITRVTLFIVNKPCTTLHYPAG